MNAIAMIALCCGSWVASAGATAAEGNTEPPAAEAITVELLSGRRFTAAIDARTNPDCLWLCWQDGAASLSRPIHWSRVVKAWVAGKELAGGQLQGLVREVQLESAGRPGHAPVSGKPRSWAKPLGAEERAEKPDVHPTAPPPAPRVRSLAVEAEVGRWDANVEATGIVVRIFPLDAAGRMVAIDGTLDVELIGRETGAAPPSQPFARLGHWSQRVRPDDFGTDGAVYRLPFQGAHPEFDLAIAPRGAVHARLSVPAHGTFEATAVMVRIRPYSSVRDQLQQSAGRRFFPQETTADGRH